MKYKIMTCYSFQQKLNVKCTMQNIIEKIPRCNIFRHCDYFYTQRRSNELSTTVFYDI